jgi:GMP synthase (glutamine-hydrolysing)
MPKLLVFQHVAYELLGTLNPQLKDAGFRIRYVNFGREPHACPSLDGYQGVVVLGGPMNMDEADSYPHIATEVELVRQAIDRNMPVLGICLGAQIIATALGAAVGPARDKEIGWYPVSPTDEGAADPLIGRFAGTEQIFQWHGDTFEIAEGAVQLASSPGCPNQAFRFGDRVYGLQFHLEVDEPMIERWLHVPHHKAEIAELGGKIDPDIVRADTKCNIDRSQELARLIFAGFIDLFSIREKMRVLPSR